MTVEGSLKSIKNARSKRKTFEEEVRGALKAVLADVTRQERQISKLMETVNKLIEASNNASILLGCVERFLDKGDPEWDEGLRKEVDRKASLLKERAALHAELNEGRERTPERSVEVADRLWEIASEIGPIVQEGFLSIGLLLQARALESAVERIEAIRASGEKIPADAEKVIAKFEERLAELRAEESSALPEEVGPPAPNESA